MMNSTKFLLTLLWGLALGGCATSNDPSLPIGQTAAVHTGERTEAEVVTTTNHNPLPATMELTATPVDYTGRSGEDYRIGPEDLLELQTFGVPELSRTVRVSSRGIISLPLIGEVKVAGLTSSALEKRLAELLAKDYLQNPQVSVFIKEFISQRVTVSGAVNKPGVYPLKGRTTLLQAIALAGDLDDKASPSDQVTVFRTPPTGGKQALEFNFSEISKGQNPDPVVQNDDIITVRTNTIAYGFNKVLSTIRGLIPPYPIWGNL